MYYYTHIIIYTDGASRSNPGDAAYGVHIVDGKTLATVADFSGVLGTATNNVAEYQAVLHALEWLLEHKNLLADTVHLLFRTDSQLVASQLRGEYKIKDSKMRQLEGEIRERLRQLPGTHTFEYIPREENKEADKLANDALNRG
jgi:ribonuclease HI